MVEYFSFPVRKACLKVLLLFFSPKLWRQSSVEKSSSILPRLSRCSALIPAPSPQPCCLSSTTGIFAGDLDQFLNITLFLVRCNFLWGTQRKEKVNNNLAIKGRQHIAITKIANLLMMRYICLVVGIIWENF